jgi:hypothetical protein
MIKLQVNISSTSRRTLNKLQKNLQVSVNNVLPKELSRSFVDETYKVMQTFIPIGVTGNLRRQGFAKLVQGKRGSLLSTGKIYARRGFVEQAYTNEVGTSQIKYFRVSRGNGSWRNRPRISKQVSNVIDQKVRRWVEKSPKLTEDFREAVLDSGILRVGRYPSFGKRNQYLKPTFRRVNSGLMDAIILQGIAKGLDKIIKR